MASLKPWNPRWVRVWIWLGGLLVVVLLGAALLGDQGIGRHERLHEELRQIEAFNQTLYDTNLRLSAEAHALRQNDRYIEWVIRDELGWARADEVVFLFDEGGL